jgi:hypothetical protein
MSNKPMSPEQRKAVMDRHDEQVSNPDKPASWEKIARQTREWLLENPARQDYPRRQK